MINLWIEFKFPLLELFTIFVESDANLLFSFASGEADSVFRLDRKYKKEASLFRSIAYLEKFDSK